MPHDLRFLSTANLCLFVLQMWILVNRRPVHRGSWARRPTWRGNATATLVSICKRRLQSAHSANVKSRPRRTEFQTRHLSSLRSRIVLYFRASADHNFALYRGCLCCDQPPTTVCSRFGRTAEPSTISAVALIPNNNKRAHAGEWASVARNSY